MERYIYVNKRIERKRKSVREKFLHKTHEEEDSITEDQNESKKQNLSPLPWLRRGKKKEEKDEDGGL